MALANSSLQSHISPNSTASLFRTTKEIRKTPEEQAPRLLQKYQQTQFNSDFANLPQELELLVLSTCSKQGASDALLKLGLTSRYWHLRVRHHIENHPDGQSFRRAHEYHQFVALNGRTPIEVAKHAIKQSQGFEGTMMEAIPENTISKLKLSPAPVVIKVRPSSKWSNGFVEGLAARKGCVTVLDMGPRAESSKFVVRAINATPRGGYLALMLPPEGMPPESTDNLVKAIKKNPVMCYVATLVDDPVVRYLPNNPDLSLLAACAENQIEGILFRFEYGDIDKEEAQLLADVLRKFKTPVSLEIFSLKTSQESMDVIIEAVRSVNQSSPGTVALTCDGSEIGKAVGKAKFKELAQDGIRFVNTRACDDDSSESDPLSDDDSDTIVRTTSSEEDSGADYEFDLRGY